jgi:hypothetical protein
MELAVIRPRNDKPQAVGGGTGMITPEFTEGIERS